MSDSKNRSTSQVLKVSPTLAQAMKTEALSAAKLAKTEGISKEDFQVMMDGVMAEVWEDSDGPGPDSEPVPDPEG